MDNLDFGNCDLRLIRGLNVRGNVNDTSSRLLMTGCLRGVPSAINQSFSRPSLTGALTVVAHVFLGNTLRVAIRHTAIIRIEPIAEIGS